MDKYKYKHYNSDKITEAKQWLRDGDHDKVFKYVISEFEKYELCEICGCLLANHGKLKRGHLKFYRICPGDYIIKKVIDNKSHYNKCNADLIENFFELKKDDCKIYYDNEEITGAKMPHYDLDFLKTDINNFLFSKIPDTMTIKELEEIANQLYRIIFDRIERDRT